MTIVDETHQQGYLSIENLEIIQQSNKQDCDVGLQVSSDGRIWLCVDGIAFIRFKPKQKHYNEQTRSD